MTKKYILQDIFVYFYAILDVNIIAIQNDNIQ